MMCVVGTDVRCLCTSILDGASSAEDVVAVHRKGATHRWVSPITPIRNSVTNRHAEVAISWQCELPTRLE